ncbi:ATPase [Bacteroidia bacterium]|nr:ATPase [Bacteroidia bacterium]
MKQILINPFLLTGYEGDKYFCDRDEETKKITEALINGRNLTLISPRRMGKTGLIHHVFHHLEEQQRASCFYLDIYQTHSLHDFVQLFAAAIIGSLDTKSQKLMNKVFSFFKSIRLILTTDSLSGAPQLTFDLAKDKTEESLKEIFAYLVDSGKVCYIAFDEFQQITNYPEKGVEALLRSYIQRLTNVHFVFSGSQKHVMENLFTSASRPFYQSTQLLQLKEIGESDYQLFAQNLFEEGNKKITTEATVWVYQVVHGHTWYVQVLFNRLYALQQPLVDIAQAEKILANVLEENEVTYLTYGKLITAKQLALLKAIAAEGSVSEPTASTFIGKYNLGATSTVSASLKSLLAKELLFDNRGSYFVYDRFFSLWLK